MQTLVDDLDRQIVRELENDDPSVQIRDLRQQRDDVLTSIPTLDNLRWPWIAAAATFYTLGLLPPAFLLRRALLSLGESCRLRTAMAAQLLGHAGKYLPGKAMVVVLRVSGLKVDDVRALPATVGVFMETLTTMAVGAAVAGVVICWLPVPGWMIAVALAVAIGASIPTLPPVLRLVAERVSKTGATLEKDPRLHSPRAEAAGGARLFAAAWGCSLLSWSLIGAAFTCLIHAIPSVDALPSSWFVYAIGTASISLAMVAGFVSLLPGGAGVRELVLAAVLAPSVGSAHALLAAIAARLLFILVEAILAAAAWLWLRGRGTGERTEES